MKFALKSAVGVAIAILLVISFRFWAHQQARTFFCPLAPPMPGAVDLPMPEILRRLTLILHATAPQVLAGLQPGLSEQEIEKLERQYNVRLPNDLKAIYEWHDGARHSATYLGDNFIPLHRFVPLEEALKKQAAETARPAARFRLAIAWTFFGYRDKWYCLLDDGAGNGCFFDLARKPAEGAIFCTFTENNELTYFPTPRNLMAGIATCYAQGAYHVSAGRSRLEVEENLEQSAKIWREFGASIRQ
ncbi:MAG TPA: SMI1/KNR4 family protein [Verrucomicrobiae bacterium]